MASAPESVAIRHRAAFDFETHYCSLCALQDTVPLLEVKVRFLGTIPIPKKRHIFINNHNHKYMRVTNVNF